MEAPGAAGACCYALRQWPCNCAHRRAHVAVRHGGSGDAGRCDWHRTFGMRPSRRPRRARALHAIARARQVQSITSIVYLRFFLSRPPSLKRLDRDTDPRNHSLHLSFFGYQHHHRVPPRARHATQHWNRINPAQTTLAKPIAPSACFAVPPPQSLSPPRTWTPMKPTASARSGKSNSSSKRKLPKPPTAPTCERSGVSKTLSGRISGLRRIES
jgi:hypothetical protein